MSISSEITRINQNIASAYTACNNKGATMPQTQNSANLATAISSISSGVTPSGSINITANGTYDVTNKASAVVAVPGSTNSRCFTVTLSSDVSGAYYVVNPNGDSEIASHRHDSSFVVGYMRTSSYLNKTNTFMAMGTNHEIVTDKGYMGTYGRYGSNGSVSGTTVSYSVDDDTKPNGAGVINVDSDGVIRIYGSSTYILPSGTYTVICGW